MDKKRQSIINAENPIELLLVQEDSDYSKKLLGSLKKANLKVDWATTIFQIEPLLKSFPNILLIIDLQLPNCAAFKIIDTLLKKGYNPRFLMLDEKANAQSAKKVFEKNGMDYLVKDDSLFTRLPQLINKCLHLQKIEANLLEAHNIKEDFENQALHNKAQLLNALKMAKLGHWELDVASLTFTFSDSFYSVFKTTAKQMGGYQMPASEYAKRFVHPKDASAVESETRLALEADDPKFTRYIEHRIFYADGSMGHMAVRFFIVKDKHGQTIKTYGVNQDITERRQKEEHEKFQSRINQISADFASALTNACKDFDFKKAATWALEALGELLNADRSYIFFISQNGNTSEKIFCCNKEKAYPKRDIIKELSCDDILSLKQIIITPIYISDLSKTKKYKTALLEDDTSCALLFPLRGNGKEIIGIMGFDTVFTKHQWSKEQMYMLEVVSDLIGQAHQRFKAQIALFYSEQQYRTLVSNIPGITYRCSCDKDKAMHYISSEVENLTGYKASDFLHNCVLSYNNIIHKEDRSTVTKIIENSILSKTYWEIEYRIIHKNGSVLWVNEKGRAIFDETGKVQYLDGFIFDVTQKILVIEELKQAKVVAEAATFAKSEFLANMSHEIRTPLNGVIGFTNLLLKTPLNSSQQQYANYVNLSAKALLEIINDILDFSKIEAGKLELEICETDIVSLAQQAIDIIRFHAHTKGLELLLNVDPSMPRLIKADPVRLKQVLVNLLQNAVKFTTKGEVELRLEFKRKTNTFGEYFFSIRDTGIGIPEDKKTRLFKAFSQADSSTTREYGGTGLGLFISNLLIEKMGGSISFDSVFNHGSTFCFNIFAQCKHKFLNTQPILKVKTVLITDTNKNNCSILEKYLNHLGIQAHTCDNFDSTLDLLKKNKFDLLLIERSLFENELSEKNIPIAFLNSSLEDAAVLDINQTVYNLEKPVKFDQLLDVINKISTSKIDKSETKSYITPEFYETLNFKNENYSILIVEDVPLNLELVKDLVKEIFPASSISEAVNGAHALEILQSNHIDLVLMDLHMPKMDGFKAARLIRKTEENKNTHLPIIALSAGITIEEREKAKNCGMDDFISKPIDFNILEKVLKKWL